MTTNKYIINPKVYNMSLDERMNYNKKCAIYGKQVYDEMLKYGLVSLDTLEKTYDRWTGLCDSYSESFCC